MVSLEPAVSPGGEPPPAAPEGKQDQLQGLQCETRETPGTDVMGAGGEYPQAKNEIIGNLFKG
jgi:hypothetical protein